MQIPSDEGPAVAGRARLHRREEPSPVQAGAAGVGELRLSAPAQRAHRTQRGHRSAPSDGTGLALVGAICADRSNIYYALTLSTYLVYIFLISKFLTVTSSKT